MLNPVYIQFLELLYGNQENRYDNTKTNNPRN